MLCSIFSYDFPKIGNLPMIFLRKLENTASGFRAWLFRFFNVVCMFSFVSE